jgi:exodeoxyribonuclease VII large subunit
VISTRQRQAEEAVRLRDHGRRAVLDRARRLSLLSRAPAVHLERQRNRLHQQLREVRAGSRRRVDAEGRTIGRRVLVLARKAESAIAECRERRPRELQQLALALAAHDPQRTLERGYVLAQSEDGRPVVRTDAARREGALRLRFADGSLSAKVQDG